MYSSAVMDAALRRMNRKRSELYPASPSPSCFGVVALSPALAIQNKQSKPESPLAKTLIGGTVTVMFEAFFGGHLLEFLKIAKQTSPNKSYYELFRGMTQQKGLAGILDGFLPWGALQSLTKGAVFGWGHAAAMKLLDGNQMFSDSTNTIIAGGMGGFVQGVALSPVLLLKTRVMTNDKFRASGGVLETAAQSARVGADIIKEEGIMALTKGMGVFSAKRFADWTTRYFFVVQVESAVKYMTDNDQLSMGTKMMCSLAGGTISALVTIPIDVLVATFQQASKAGQNVSIVETYKEALKGGGMQGVASYATRGLVARVAHVALTTLMMKTVTSLIYDMIK